MTATLLSRFSVGIALLSFSLIAPAHADPYKAWSHRMQARAALSKDSNHLSYVQIQQATAKRQQAIQQAQKVGSMSGDRCDICKNVR